MSEILDIPLRRIDGQPASLRDHAGRVLLIVNVASECGLTPQYDALQALYASRRARGLDILAFPSNDFGAQEPGTHEEIRSFCTTRYGVAFPLFEKTSVAGPHRHPLYAALTALRPVMQGGDTLREKLRSHGMPIGVPGEVLWNFEKFVVDRQGEVLARFAPDVTPEDARLLACIDEALGPIRP
jgi:glutathione peroxidase